MKKCWQARLYRCTLLLCITTITLSASAQTDIDGIMMTKNNFCVGGMYGYSSWKNYWEGTLKRNNLNLGTISTQMISVMGNYGITDKLNVIIGAPYVSTKASAGTLHGVHGVQDGSLWVKYMPYETKGIWGDLSVYGIAGVSIPLTNYVADFLPLSIGLRSKTLSLRAMGDYQLDKFFITASGTYVFRSNIKIDRDEYYTTEMHYTNQVQMPNVMTFNVRAGYRYNNWVAEAIFDKYTTLGGFDITRNNMPFPSNRMKAIKLGFNCKYELRAIRGLSLIGSGSYVIAGRNMGQATSVEGGIFYILNFSKKAIKATLETKKQ